MPFLTANGIRTYYEAVASGDSLLLLHNDALSLDVWRRLIPHLAAQHRVIAYDRRGHGQSEIPPREAPYSVEVLGEDLRGLLDQLEISEADLFGCSGGADHSTLLEPSGTLLSAIRDFLASPVSTA